MKRDLKRDLVRMYLNENLSAAWYVFYLIKFNIILFRYRVLIEFRTRICQSEAEGAQCISQMSYGKVSVFNREISK